MSQVVVGTDLAYAGFWVAALFTPVISLYWPWWRHDLGWSIAAESWAFALILFPAQLRLFFGINIDDVPWFGWVRLAAFTVAIAVFPWRAWAT